MVVQEDIFDLVTRFLAYMIAPLLSSLALQRICFGLEQGARMMKRSIKRLSCLKRIWIGGIPLFLGQESNPASAEKLEKMMDNLYMMYTPAEEWGYKIIRTSSEATSDREVKLLPSWANSWFKGPARTWSYQFVNDIMSKLNFSSNPDILDLLHRLAWSDPRDCDLTRFSESNLIELPSADSRLEPHLTSDTDSICTLLEELEETLTHLEPESGETGFFSMDSIGLESENGEPGEPCANGTELTHNADHELASLLDTNPEKDWGYQQSGGGSSDSSVKEIFKDITNLAIGE